MFRFVRHIGKYAILLLGMFLAMVAGVTAAAPSSGKLTPEMLT